MGKSTLAAALAKQAACPLLATDTMGQHPGRPWTRHIEPVMAFYEALPADAHLWFLHAHHRTLKPLIGNAIAEANRAGTFVMEGAALRPEYFADWDVPSNQAVCLWAPDDTLTARIQQNSRYADQPDRLKGAIDAFLARSLHENAMLRAVAEAFGVEVINTDGLSKDAVLAQLKNSNGDRHPLLTKSSDG
ncbi:MAG: hypothetical protein AAGO57_05825 [Pseudomonadota bacterium]